MRRIAPVFVPAVSRYMIMVLAAALAAMALFRLR
jgi:hypothetical protein